MEAYIGEIRIFGGNFAPVGWAFCDGQVLPIAEYDALFSLIGTTYGGDGQTTFALPDLRGRIPLSQGQSTTGRTYNLGEKGGTEQVSLTLNQLPAHTHTVNASTAAGDKNSPQNATWASGNLEYAQDGSNSFQLHQQNISPTGSGQAHNNMMPYLPVHFIICLTGLYPPRD